MRRYLALLVSSFSWLVAISAISSNIPSRVVRTRASRPHFSPVLQDSFLFRRANVRVSATTRFHYTTTVNTWRRLHPRLPSALGLSFLTAFSLYTRQAVARSLELSRPKHPVRTALNVVALCCAIVALVQQIRGKRRQALDATSEWGRYAAHPGARGRAVVALCFQILPYWLVELVCRTKAARTRLRKQSGSLFADGLLKLGPLYIKLGQIVSCREKLLPNEWKEALEKLQDRVPSRSGQAALDLAYSSIGSKETFEEMFSDFTTTPLAAASLGQVHKAVLRETNDTVAVKVQRPYLREIYDQDFLLLLNIATVMDKFMGKKAQVGGVTQSWTEIFTDARTILYREIDYRDEADNAIRFAEDFGIGKEWDFNHGAGRHEKE